MGISARDFRAIEERLAGRGKGGGRAPTPVLQALPRFRSTVSMLGIDPSLRGTGYGVIQAAKGGVKALAWGTIHCPAGWERSRCLAKILEETRRVIREHQPSICAIESLFFTQNMQTAILMGEARGVALAAAAEAGLEIYELAPRKVKQAIVGFGAAQKLAVARMVQRLLGLAELPAPDAADALALALTHAQEQGRHSLTPPRRI